MDKEKCGFVCTCGDPCVSQDPITTVDGLTYCTYHWKVYKAGNMP